MDAVIETEFPNIRRPLKIHIIIQHSQAVVERLSKMGLIMTKKRCPLKEESLNMLIRIFLMIFDRIFENAETQKQLLSFKTLCLLQKSIFCLLYFGKGN